MRVLLVLIHPRTNLTTRALAALFHTSQSTVDRTIHHLVPVLAQALQPDPTGHAGVWIIDGTLIPVHDQSITFSKNYRRPINTCCQTRGVVSVGGSWPGNRNDVVVARTTSPAHRRPKDPRRRHQPKSSIIAGLWNLKPRNQLRVNS